MKFSRLQWLIFVVVDFLTRIPTHFADGYYLAFHLHELDGSMDPRPMLFIALVALVLSALHIASLFVAQRLTARLRLPPCAKFVAMLVLTEIMIVPLLILPQTYECLGGQSWCFWRDATLYTCGKFAIELFLIAAINLPSIPIAAGAGYLESRIRQYRGTLYAKFSLRFVLVQIVSFAGIASLWITFATRAFLDSPRYCLALLGGSLNGFWIMVTKFPVLVTSNLPLALISICVGCFAVHVSRFYRAGVMKSLLKFGVAFGLTEVFAFAACFCLWGTHLVPRFLDSVNCGWIFIRAEQMQSIVGEVSVLFAINLVPVLVILETLRKSR
jgi:hypothetical protein